MRHLLWLGLVTCGATGVSPESPRSQAPPGLWDHWGDGRAELDGYRLTQPRYGELRHGTAVLVFVTEDFTRAGRVKSDGGHGDEFPVIKLNEVRDFTTGIYDYNVLTSSFVPLDGSLALGQATKLSLSVQEWCGHVYEQWGIDPGRASVVRHSYFDGEGDSREQVAVPADAVLGDAWPIVVRGLAGELVRPGETVERPWLPPLLQARFAHRPSAFVSVRLTRSADVAPIVVPAGTFDAWTVRVEEAGGRTSTWWIEAAAPHRIVRWEASDGELAELTGSVREPYWKEHGEGDTGRRAALGL